MSEFMLNVLDEQRAVHARIDGAFAERLVAALAAEPETIEELQTAVGRFVRPEGRDRFFANWSDGVWTEPAGGGIGLVDLPARLVVAESSCFSPAMQGQVEYHDGTAATDIWLPYRLPADWSFGESIRAWRQTVQGGRRRRVGHPRCDAREVLYGKVAAFCADAYLAAPGRAADSAAAVHARWLLQPRTDLKDRAPRDLLLAKRHFIDADLQHQAVHWSAVGDPPPGLDRRSAAYRFAGFGTQEIVVYYDLVRHLLGACLDYLATRKSVTREALVAHLEQLQQEWLHSPQTDDLEGHSPAQVIHRERARLPLVVTDHSHGFEDDCPLCQMLAEIGGPTFWYLDGCNMDDDFAFSFHATRRQWEAERREWEEMDRAADSHGGEPDLEGRADQPGRPAAPQPDRAPVDQFRSD